jgi:hypothetical protein
MLAAIDEAERSLAREGGVPVDDFRKNLRVSISGWSCRARPALRDLGEIGRYIGQDNPSAADRDGMFSFFPLPDSGSGPSATSVSVASWGNYVYCCCT